MLAASTVQTILPDTSQELLQNVSAAMLQRLLKVE
jgi:hypothetical protein